MTRRTLAIGDDGDLVITAGQLVILSDGDAIKQAVRSMLRTIKGEWFLDTSVGVDHLGKILVTAPDLGVIRAELVRAIESVAGVDTITAITLSHDRQARTLAVTFTASTDTGELISDTVEV